jgi:ribosomal protein S18 acetylase RimI-like enzyme
MLGATGARPRTAWQALGVIEVHQATADDLGSLSTTLARAFGDDPVMGWLIGENHHDRLRRFFAAELRQYLRSSGEVLTNARRQAGALWAAPGQWRTGWLDMLRSAPAMLRALRGRVPRGIRALGVIERTHPREPHWYLGVLGTDPEAQGRGIASALLQPVLERCDRSGLGAYLESSKEQNILYYQRFGFTVTGEIPLPDGPTLWPMWRDPA